MPHRTATKGNIGVAAAIADLMQKGWDVLLPFCHTSPFDLVAYRDGRFVRVQVKYRTPNADGVMEVRLFRRSMLGGRLVHVPNDEADMVCICDGVSGRCYYVPAWRCPVRLRLTAPKNGQTKGVALASDYLGTMG